MMLEIIVAGIIVTLIIILVGSAFKTIRPTTRGLVERFGKYVRFAQPGLNVIIPFIENVIEVNITEQMVSSDQKEIITADSLNATVDANIYFKIKSDESSVKASVYSVNACKTQIIALAQTTLRNIIGSITLKQANSERSTINNALYEQLTKETSTWGIEIVRTELKEIVPPEAVQQVMNQVVVASNEKMAAIDFATAVETKADGAKRASIKEAEGEKQSRILRAEGEAQAIKIVNEAAEKYFIGNAQILKQLEVTADALANNSKIVLPSGQSITNVIGSLAGVVKD